MFQLQSVHRRNADWSLEQIQKAVLGTDVVGGGGGGSNTSDETTMTTTTTVYQNDKDISTALKNSNDDNVDDDDGNFPDRMPSCRAVMQTLSEFANGEFLSRTSTPYRWIPRHDGSQRLELDTCRLHRYTRDEVLQCLDGKHINFIGDSLTRYQFTSLAYFIEKGVYPPRFGRRPSKCTHLNRHGEPICSPSDQPNVCMEGDWAGASVANGRDSWTWMFTNFGGGRDDGDNNSIDGNGGLFGGRMQCSCARRQNVKCSGGAPPGSCTVENQFYVSDSQSPHGRVAISNIKEDGWGASPRDMAGFNFTDCAYNATCRYSVAEYRANMERAQNFDVDWRQNFTTAVAPGGVFSQQLPPVDIALYNRGLWGTLTQEQAKERLPLLRNLAQERCFYRTTTGSPRSPNIRPKEMSFVKDETLAAGCEFLDIGHLTSVFVALNDKHANPERATVYWDAIHFQPWVYEEINTVLLNVLCNAKQLSTETK